MRTNNIYKIYGIITLLSIITFGACLRDDIPPKEATGAEVKIQIKIPGMHRYTDTRSLDGQKECEVDDLIILAFEQGRYCFKSEARLIRSDAGNNLKTCYITLKRGTYDLMFFANCKSIIDGFIIPPEATKETFRKGLMLNLSGKWNTGGDFTPLPMWGEKNTVTIAPDMSIEGDDAIQLVRSVAKVDITIDRSKIPENDFTLNRVYLYHWSSTSQVIPDLSVWDPAANKVTGISESADTRTTVDQRLEYTKPGTEVDWFLTNTIYLPETAAGTDSEIPVTPSVVLGAMYKGEQSWYRVDFLDDAGNFLPLLRNYRYEVQLIGVDGRGYSEMNEAYRSRSQNLTVRIIAYDDGALTNVIHDGQYYLAWDPAVFTLTREQRTTENIDNKITLDTNNEEGWIWTKTVDENNNSVSWVHLSAEDQKGEKGKKTVSLLIDVAHAEAAPDRVAFMHFTAGRMDMNIQVIQTGKSEITLKILDADGNDISGTTRWVKAIAGKEVEKLLFVEWGPVGAVCNVSIEKVDTADENVAYLDGKGITAGELTAAKGIHRYHLQFRPFDITRDYNTTRPNDITRYQSKYTFTATYNGESVSREIVVNHHLDMFSNEFNEWYYLGVRHSGGFYSSTSYQVTEVREENTTHRILHDASPIEQLNRSLGDGETKRESIFFNLKNPTIERDNNQFFVRFTFPDSELPDTVIAVRGYKVYPNSYMAKSGETIRFLIRKPWRVWKMMPANTPLKDGGNMECKVLWSDVSGLISSVAFEHKNGVFDKDETEIAVTVGSPSNGNAVIALYQDNEIIWSWHIWVTDYMPDSSGTFTYAGNVFMDRNMGATANSRTEFLKAMGLLYQWGRKDPFPPSTQEDRFSETQGFPFLNYHRPIYNNTGQFTVEPSNKSGSTENLTKSFNNPMAFITSTNDWCELDLFQQRWYLRFNTDDEASRPTYYFKNEYDPCPEGWIVPINRKGNNFPWYVGGIEEFLPNNAYIAEKGVTRNENNDYIPATGYMNATTGDYMQIGYFSYLLCAHSVNDNAGNIKGYKLVHRVTSGNPNKGNAWSIPAEGDPVRCIKDVFFLTTYD